MTTQLRVLTDADLAQIHDRALDVLSRVGVRVDSAQARGILEDAGAEVGGGDHVVRFPRDLVEASLASVPRSFSLGGRRPGWSLPMNAGECTLMLDGEAVSVYDVTEGARRPSTMADWEEATRFADTVDEVGIYWRMVTAGLDGMGPGAAVGHWASTLRLFSKHVQDSAADATEGAWLLEVLGTVFGGREAVRRAHPFSFLACPLSPLVLEDTFTDAYLATRGWDIPIAVMPMPMMGLSSPTGLRNTIILGTAEVLAMLCLVQAAAPGTPFLYAPALAVMEPRSGRWSGGSVEHALLAAATTEVARFYGLPATTSTGGADHYLPGIQSAYERAITWSLATLSWPDILIGPGTLGGASTLCLEQLVLDVEVFRACRRLRTGIDAATGEEDVVQALLEVGHAGDFLARPATRDAVHGGEWHLPRLGFHGTWEGFEAKGRPDILAEARAVVDRGVAGHVPLPMDEAVSAELEQIERRARETRVVAGAS